MATRIIAGTGGSVERYKYRRADDKLAWQSIERALDVEGSSFGDRRRVHRSIRIAINWHLGWHSVWDGAPGEAEVRQRIEKVRGAAEALDRELAALTDTEVALLQTADIRSGRNWLSYTSGFRGPVLDLVRLANSVLATLPKSRGGPPEDLPKRVLIERLDDIFRETGKIPTAGSENQGEFVTLISSVLILAGEEESAAGLGKAVQRIWSAQETRDTTHREL